MDELSFYEHEGLDLRWLLRAMFFFFNDTATTEIYTLSLHDALPISWRTTSGITGLTLPGMIEEPFCSSRSEEHTSELQSRVDLVCRLLLEKKKQRFHNRGSPCAHKNRGARAMRAARSVLPCSTSSAD